jgi:hypothetical protein
MRQRKTFRQFCNELWQPTIGYVVAYLVLLLLFVYRIKDLVPGFSSIEKSAITATNSGALIMENPLFAPHKVLQYIIQKLGHSGFFAMRGVSIVIGIGIVFLLFITIKRWFSFRIALITSVLFATSSWFLFTVRLATPDIMVLSILSIIAYGSWLTRNPLPKKAIIVGFLLTTWLLYIPGMILFLVGGFVWQRKSIAKITSQEKLTTLIVGISAVALLAPLLFGFYQDPGLFKMYVGFSADPLAQLAQIPKNLLLVPYQIVIASRLDAARGITGVPLLDILTVVMALIGGYYYFINDRSLDRTKILFGGALVSWLLISLNGLVGIQILLPFIYLFVAGGFAHMLEQWFKVFPSNPFAKVTAIILITVSVGAVCTFHIRKYFIAWPQTPTTKTFFNEVPAPSVNPSIFERL